MLEVENTKECFDKSWQGICEICKVELPGFENIWIWIEGKQIINGHSKKLF